MSEKNTGGFAFPHEDGQFEGENDTGSHGMTLRDYFAAKAMQSLLEQWSNGYDGVSLGEARETIANRSYLVADAMLEARNG